MKKVALDTNAYVALLKGDPDILTVLNTAEEVLMPITVYAELLYGFKNGSKVKENLVALNSFLKEAVVSLTNTTGETADIYSDVVIDLRSKVKPIPTNDIWIAALAIEYGAVLLSYDKHFENISQLRLWSGGES